MPDVVLDIERTLGRAREEHARSERVARIRQRVDPEVPGGDDARRDRLAEPGPSVSTRALEAPRFSSEGNVLHAPTKPASRTAPDAKRGCPMRG